MGKTKIEWTDMVWQVVSGCSPVSAGCEHCWAARMAATRLKHHPRYAELAEMQDGRPRWTGEVRLNRDVLGYPASWRKPRRVFVASMGDLFHEDIKYDFLDEIFDIFSQTPHHIYQILTKRPERMLNFITSYTVRFSWAWTGSDSEPKRTFADVFPNVWPGITVENQQTADERREAFRATPAAVKYVSYEPALGSVDWTGWEFVDQIISGGETGPRARPSHPDWHRATRDFCQANGIAYFFKQHGEWEHSSQCVGSHTRALLDGYYWNDDSYSVKVGKKRAGRLLDGVEWSEMP